MDVKEVAHLAKEFAVDLFKDEGIRDARLEEVEHDEGRGLWHVTVSFLRDPPAGDSGIAAFLVRSDRSFKVITLSEPSRSIISVKQKERVG